ncbi:alpha/beta hydrolase [Paractinoplanes abujensis]|uniref:Pimeloyl-ACP methyl ester carboxylesterase n=1 Tax=Paractinoplanes abujensis TaxID=882441 RepID=A0A7W7G2I9_9ACTN|nr:alpha/beta hydrolase [Actinoplanes abujensis]MBB4693220.1 pimeloyl-ACP methyl ester carboxylesterase [Actinoplanes abujensis]GID24419.1 alpha/beta hydrolase [Actinoplanes abujensis]
MSSDNRRTRVLVHGVPETTAIWQPLLSELAALGAGNVVTLNPPGFGAPLPAGFEATLDGYRDWLIDELTTFDAPVDLVGHDFGGIHAAWVMMDRPDLIHSWANDVLGVLEPDYEWHETARIWQTPEVGEAFNKDVFTGTDAYRAGLLRKAGIPSPTAEQVAPALNADMERAVLSLYRSAAQPVMAERGRDLTKAAARPGLAIIGTADHAVGSVEQRRRAAGRAGAKEIREMAGSDHWWMLEDPKRAALMLTAFWATV